MVIHISEREEIRERFGKLAIYLIEKARKEIKELNQQFLLERGEVRKKYSKRQEERSNKIKEEFIESYQQSLNEQLSRTLLKSKDEILKLKKDLINQLISDICAWVQKLYEQNYPRYIQYLKNRIKGTSHVLRTSSPIQLMFNSKDYKYFNSHPEQLDDILDKNVKLSKIERESIGGFEIYNEDKEIYYDYTLDSFIQEHHHLIEKEFSKTVLDTEFGNIRDRFEHQLKEKKEDIEDYLREYERI